ncbi:MAG: YdcF family protein [Candidatus Margulisbacteria bacterium]|jgi:uncharacterized SAM-binding protein YcdF (DUF218 family)|nr:YdcF family protein [Candidatus Margulisiibacteriota bacterium]
MFILAKIFTFTLLSPGLFLALLLLLLAAIIADCRRTSIFLVVLSCCTIYALSSKPVRDLLIYPLEASYRQTPNPDIDALIVLGGGVRHNTLDKPGQAVVSDATLQRLYHAYKIYRQKGTPIIVCGGSPLGRQPDESSVMAAALVNLGVPRGKIHQEKLSRNTKENLLNAKIYLQKYGYQKPGLVTSAAHMPRAMQTAAGLGIKAAPLPCDYKYGGRQYFWQDFFPDTGYLSESFAALKEYTGLVYYRQILVR